MNAVVPRERLARVLGMLGSASDGEALNAARAAERLRQAAGLSWSEMLSTAAPAPTQPAAPPPSPWRAMLAACQRRPEVLTEWEQRFIATLGQQGSVSRRQWAILTDIHRKAKTA